MSVSFPRLQDLSVLHYIKDSILPFANWIELVTSESLTLDRSKGLYMANSTVVPNPVSEGRGWVYFDALSSYLAVPTTEQTTRVTVYNQNGASIASGCYSVNYMRGGIQLHTTVSGIPTTVDYSYNYVGVLLGWVNNKPPALPFVCIMPGPSSEDGFEIGLAGGRKHQDYKVEVFANSSGERRDLLEILKNAFNEKHVPLVDYRSYGEPVLGSGSFNSSYTGAVVDTCNSMFAYKANVSEPYGKRDNWSEVNRYRGTLSFKTETIRETSGSLTGF